MGELERRRSQLFNLLPDNSVSLVFSGVSKVRSEDAYYDFHANRNFFYLTGIELWHSVLRDHVYLGGCDGQADTPDPIPNSEVKRPGGENTLTGKIAAAAFFCG